MGSVCCVPAKSQRQSRDDPSETNWRMNGDFSPAPARWESKAPAADDVAASTGTQLYRSSFSSSSRGSRRASSRFLGQRSTGGIVSQEPSPSSSFRAAHLNPLASSQICPLVDVVPVATSDSSSSPCMTISPSKEGFLSTALSTPESVYSNTAGDCSQTPLPKQFTSNPLTGHHCSKSVPEKQFSGLESRSPLFPEDRLFVKRSGSGDMGPVVGGTSDRWSMQTFSELVASSRKERLRWMSPSSPEESSGLEGFDPADFLALDKIKACSTQAGYASPNTEAFFCGLCCRWLSQRSPLSSHKMIGNTDLPSVGVLSCGHVFHADCLDQATSEDQKQDPSCPQCATKAHTSRGLLKSSNSKYLSRTTEEEAPVFSSSEREPAKRTFSFKSKPVTDLDLRTKKSTSFSQVSPDNQIDYSPPTVSARRGSSFRYLRGW